MTAACTIPSVTLAHGMGSNERQRGNLYDMFFEPGYGRMCVAVPETIFLYGLVQAVRPVTLVETGTYRGFTTAVLALALGMPTQLRPGHVHTFDIETYEHAAGALWRRWGVAERITFHHQRSDQPPAEIADVDFIFFDADHGEAYVIGEWCVWRERLRPGAIVLWHDVLAGLPSRHTVDRIIDMEGLRLGGGAITLSTPNGMVMAQWFPT